jgi:hypothetical protein
MRTNIVWTALELRPEAKTDLIHAVGPHGTVVIEDYIEPPPNSELSALSRISPGFAVALGNPPYRLAAEFIQRSLEVAQTVCLLLRVNFLASARRNEFMRSHVPDTYIIPNRPSFSGTGTDSPEYAWLIWTQDKREVGQLRILNTTSIEERKADKKKSKIITDETKIPTDYLVTESPT